MDRPPSRDRERPCATDSLAPGLIHEMRHPLMGIKAGLELVERAFGGQLRGSEDWALVKNQVARLEELFRNYQEFLDPRQAAASTFVLQPVVQRSNELVRHRLRRLGERFVLEMPATPLLVHGTPNAVSHALVNLLVNSLDALDEVGGKGRLALRALPAGPDGFVQLRVSDEGSGILPANASRIFEPGFTTKAPGQGSGLGLDVALRMVAAFDGSLALVPEGDPQRLPWARTEFCVRLRAGAPGDAVQPVRPAAQGFAGTPVTAPSSPAALAPAGSSAAPSAAVALPASGPAATLPASPASGRVPTSHNRAARVLVAEDESVIRFLLRKAFGEERMETLFASTGDEADYILRRQNFDLVVLDKNLPGVNGVELAKLTRERMPNAGIVMITAYASQESAQALFELGADEYLQKPFEVEHLMATARRILSRQGLNVGAPAVLPRKPSRVAVVDADERMRARLCAVVESLGLVPIAAARVGAALQASPGPDALVVAAELLSAEARVEIRRRQEEQRDFPVIALVDADSMSDTIGAISVGARAKLPRRCDDDSAARVLRSALEGGTRG